MLAVGSADIDVLPAPSQDAPAGALTGGIGLDWRPAAGRVLRAGDRVVLATTRRGLDVLMTGLQPHPPDRRGERDGR
ncbi:hypothetical protein ABZ153_31025 [Streptomyces sp. NPDC006290]|uniref:hypothetical protein n=1 Tax=Streptomyces sp. NPDC006290 TaxID=3156745 RepID=UPI0033B46512